MRKRIFAVLAMAVICSLAVSACKKNVGTPEDNAASRRKIRATHRKNRKSSLSDSVL